MEILDLLLSWEAASALDGVSPADDGQLSWAQMDRAITAVYWPSFLPRHNLKPKGYFSQMCFIWSLSS